MFLPTATVAAKMSVETGTSTMRAVSPRHDGEGEDEEAKLPERSQNCPNEAKPPERSQTTRTKPNRPNGAKPPQPSPTPPNEPTGDPPNHITGPPAAMWGGGPPCQIWVAMRGRRTKQ